LSEIAGVAEEDLKLRIEFLRCSLNLPTLEDFEDWFCQNLGEGEGCLDSAMARSGRSSDFGSTYPDRTFPCQKFP
jgi:hypothetical protein